MVYNKRVKTAAGPIRIAISGKMRSGKDTVARRLVERHGFRRFAFADRLKELAAELFGVKPGEKNRPTLVALGRRLCEIDRMVWVRHVFGKIPLAADVVVSDVRFGYELQELKRLGFKAVRIDVSRAKQLKRLAETETDADPALLDDISETALDHRKDWDVRLDGDAPVDMLMVAVDEMVMEFRRNA